ncbi:MAG: hypothetical protein OEX82_00475 [Nitrosomonas sp.]|nr:hypothetical protein [Nitrosomonas sp.]
MRNVDVPKDFPGDAMRYALILLLFFMPAFAWADGSQDIQDLINRHQSELNRIQQEAQAAHQQFMMIQELRRYEMTETAVSMQPGVTVKSIPIPKYDDMLKDKQEKEARIRQYGAELDALYLRHKELEVRRNELFDEIEDLKRTPKE